MGIAVEPAGMEAMPQIVMMAFLARLLGGA